MLILRPSLRICARAPNVLGSWFHLSNTFFFDKCLGWRGVCFEPQPQYHAPTRKSRSCHLVPHCVLGARKNVSFSGHGQKMSVVPAQPMRTPTSASQTAAEHQCVTAPEVLEPLGFGGPRGGIDLLSIDVEGMAG